MVEMRNVQDLSTVRREIAQGKRPFTFGQFLAHDEQQLDKAGTEEGHPLHIENQARGCHFRGDRFELRTEKVHHRFIDRLERFSERENRDSLFYDFAGMSDGIHDADYLAETW